MMLVQAFEGFVEWWDAWDGHENGLHVVLWLRAHPFTNPFHDIGPIRAVPYAMSYPL
jgi:hypothetical protein